MNLMAMVMLRRRKSLTTMVVVEIVVTVVAVLVGAIPLAKVVMGRNDDRGHIIPHSCAETSYTERQQFSWLACNPQLSALILDLTS